MGVGMKTKVLIIEDNHYSYFTTKAVLESQLRLSVEVKGVQTSRELLLETADYAPDVIVFRPTGGVAELLDQMKKRHTNRRNTEIRLLVAEEFDDDVAKAFKAFVIGRAKRVANAA